MEFFERDVILRLVRLCERWNGYLYQNYGVQMVATAVELEILIELDAVLKHVDLKHGG